MFDVGPASAESSEVSLAAAQSLLMSIAQPAAGPASGFVLADGAGSAVAQAMRIAEALTERKDSFEGLACLEAPVLSFLAADRERARAALERNLAVVAKKTKRQDDSSSDEEGQPSKRPGAGSKKKASRAGIGAKGANKGAKPAFATNTNTENASCYVSGLPASTTEAALEAMFRSFGKVIRVKLYRDALDLPKGDAIVTFAKAASAQRAAAQVQETQISVSLATFHSDAALRGLGPVVKPKDDPDRWLRAAARVRLDRPNDDDRQNDDRQDDDDDKVEDQREKQTMDDLLLSPQEQQQQQFVTDLSGLPLRCQGAKKPVVLLRHVYDVSQCRPGFLDELEAEIGEECSKFGAVLAVCAPLEEFFQGSVAVTFETLKAAELCALAMNGRWFDNVQILVERLGNWEPETLPGLGPHPRLPAHLANLGGSKALLRNVYTQAELEGSDPKIFLEGLEAEFAQECEKYGRLLALATFPEEPALAGSVLVVFQDEASFENCRTHMDGRWFDYRKLLVERYREPTPLVTGDEKNKKTQDKNNVLSDFFASLPPAAPKEEEHHEETHAGALENNDAALDAFFEDVRLVVQAD